MAKGKEYACDFIAYIKWGAPDEQPADEDSVPESLRKAKKLWEAAGGREGKDPTKLKEICELTAKALKCCFLKCNLTKLTDEKDDLLSEEVEGKDVVVLGVDFSDGLIPSVKAQARLKIAFKKPFLSEEDIRAWEEENDYLDAGVVFQFDTEDPDYFGALFNHQGLELSLA
jgi:hypothetical protein